MAVTFVTVVPGTATAATTPFVQDFEGLATGSDPAGWVDTGAGNSLVEDDSLFEVMSEDGSQVLGTDSTATNIHSHYIAETVSAIDGFTVSGRMKMTSSKSGIGVTFLSDYANSDTYYRLRRYSGQGGSFRLSPHGTSITSGDTNTGVVPQSGTWYEFEIAVTDSGSATEIAASVWESGTTKPSDWQIEAVDASGSRLTTGSIGVWSHSSGSKYWDDFSVAPPPSPGPWNVNVVTTGMGSVSLSPDPSGYPNGYPDGTIVDATATADPGWAFIEWSGDASGPLSPVSLTVDRDMTVQALFVEDVPVTLSTQVVGAGVLTVDPDQPTYAVGDVVTLTPTPNAGNRFSGWTGDASGLDDPLLFTMTANASITANFEPDTGILQDFEGLTTGSDPAGWLDTGARNSLVEDDSLFEVMSVDGSQVLGTDSTASNIHSHYVAETVSSIDGFTVSGRLKMTSGGSGIGVTFLSDYANSDRYYRLRRYSGQGGSFRLSPHGTSITSGTTDTGVVPQPGTWYDFEIGVTDSGVATEIVARVWESGTTKPSDWQIDAVDASGSRLTVGSIGVWGYASGSKYWDDFSVGAAPAPGPWNVSVLTTGMGSVSLSPDPSGYPDGYPDGTPVDATATADPGWRFIEWSGDASGSVSPVSLTVDRNMVVEALFVEDVPLTLTTPVVGSGAVTVDPDQPTYTWGDVVTLTPTPNAGHRFIGWSGDASGLDDPLVFTMTANATITANFELDTPLNVTLAQVGNGTVTIDPTPGPYSYGETVTVTAAPDPSWRFDRWEAQPTVAANWWDTQWGYRMGVDIDANGESRDDLVVDVPVDFSTAFSDLGVQRALDVDSIRVVEIDQYGAIVDPAVPFQFVAADDFGAAANAVGTLWVELDGTTAAGATRRYHVYFDVIGSNLPPASVPSRVTVTENVPHSGLTTLQIDNEFGTLYYDTGGGGFASVFDNSGNDWVSWSTAPGAAGEYRGISNLVYPEGYLHPGSGTATTTLLSSGPLVTTIRSEAGGGDWVSEWAIGPDFARLTVLTAADDYWVLYEGTPGGSLDTATDLVGRSDGTVTTADTDWTGDLTGDEWVFFGDPTVGRSLYMANHQDDEYVDSYRPMQGLMTVFGFGRNRVSSYLDHVPGVYSFGFVDAVDAVTVGGAVDSTTKPVAVAYPGAESQVGSSAGPVAGFDVTDDVTVTAIFEEFDAGTLTTTVVGAGSITVDPDLPEYEVGQQVTLTAVPAGGAVFDGWSGDATGTTNPIVVTIAATTSVTATFIVSPTAPVIDVWEGLDQEFGHLGVPQVAVNVHGNVSDPDGITSLTYTVNAGPQKTLRLGPDQRRLAQPGDFNVEIPVVDLLDGNNALRLTATDGSSEVAVVDVNVAFQSGNVWPSTYSVDWSAAAEIDDVGQIVDGRWNLEAGGVRIIEPFYDRLLAIGDVTWTDYEVTFPVTINAIDESGFSNGPSGSAAALGVLMRWKGHTDVPIVTSEPKSGWRPLGAIGWWWWDTLTSARMEIMNNGGGSMAATSYGTPPAVGSTLWYKMRVESNPDGSAHYSLKIWPSTQSEPASWSLEGDSAPGEAADGSLALLAHHVDATFGDVDIVPLNGAGAIELDVTVSGGGSVSVVPDLPEYTYGDQVTLTPTPDPDWVFTGWTGDVTSTDDPLVLTMTQSTAVTAEFASTTGAPIISNVVVQPTVDGATISWTTDEPTTGDVPYGTSPAYELGTESSTVLDTQHDVTLTGLASNTVHHFRIEATDATSNTSMTADMTFQTGGVQSSGFVSADFNECAVDPAWTFVDPVGDGSLVLNGTQAEIVVPGGVAHDVWSGGNMAPRLMQAVNDVDFELEAKFESAVSLRYQMQGFIVEEDAQNFLRFDIHGDGGASPRLLVARFVNGSPTIVANTPVSVSSPVWLRVGRVGDVWSYDYSTDGANWTSGASFTHVLSVSQAGVFAGNAGAAPAHTAVIDYVFDTATPVVPEDPDTPSCGQYTLTVDVVGPGSVTVSPDQPTYEAGDVVTLTPVPDAGAQFVDWTGDVTSTDDPLVLTIGGTTQVTATFQTVGGQPSGFVSDDFNACALDPAWTFVDPVGDGSLVLNGTQAEIVVPGGVAHDVWSGGNMAPRLMQSVNDVDFELVAKFESAVSLKYQIQGFIVEEDAQNFLRFDVYSKGEANPRLFAARFVNGSPTVLVNTPVSVSSPVWLRVGRVGDVWSFDYSTDGTNWTSGTSFTHALSVTQAGVFAGNAGGNAPAHTAVIDYVFDTATPVVPEDGDSVTCP